MLKLLALVSLLAPVAYSQCNSCNNNGYNSGYDRVKKDIPNMPGLLPDYTGDGSTAATRVQETRALNSLFFGEVIGEEEPYWHEERMRQVQEALWDALHSASQQQPTGSSSAPSGSSSSSNNQPGYLPDYQGDKYTNQQRIQETQALNKAFFDSIGGAPPAPSPPPAAQGENVWQQMAYSGNSQGSTGSQMGGQASTGSQYNQGRRRRFARTTYYTTNGYSNQQYGNQPCCGSSNYNSNVRMYNPSNGYNMQYGNSYGNQYNSNSPTQYYNGLINTNLGYPANNYGANTYNQNRMYDSTGMTGYNSGMSGCCSSVSSSCCYQTGTSGNVYYDPNMRSTTASPYGYGSTTTFPYTSTYMNNYGKK